MAWKVMPGLKGKVYVPDHPPGLPSKQPCTDCFSCQMCSDERCVVCLGCKDRGDGPMKLGRSSRCGLTGECMTGRVKER